MDKTTRNVIERATQQARKLLNDDFSDQLAGTFDVLRSGIVPGKGGAHLTQAQQTQREKIVAAIEHKRAAGMTEPDAITDYIRDSAFTTLNRFVALKMLETRGLVQECITKGENSAGYREFCGLAPGVTLLPDSAGYRLYIECLFDEFSTEIKVLFDRRDAASVLWPGRETFERLLAILNAQELSAVWNDDETIGWVFQFFNSGDERRKMRELSQAPRNSLEMAVRNQFFTPRYVVQFLVDNTLGRFWLEMMDEKSRLARDCEYLVRSAEVAAQEHPPKPRPRKDPRDLRILDPACGSGHFLLYSFDLLLRIYEEAWEDEQGAPVSESTGRTLRADYSTLADLHCATPRLIVEQNLYGVDIDPRCAQIAALVLWLRAQRAWKELGIAASERPPIERTHIVLAEPMPGDAALVEEFAAEELDRPFYRDLFKKMVQECRLAGELGALLRVEDGIAAELARARKQFVKERQTPGFLPGMEPSPRQGSFDLTGIDDAAFFHEVEARLCHALRKFAETTSGKMGVRKRLFAHDAAYGVALIDLARTRFDVVLMNPPFGELSEAGKNALTKAQVPRPLDAYAQFLYRCVDLLQPGGALGAILSKTFISHAEFEPLRRWMLGKRASLTCLAEMGPGVLDAAVEVALITLNPGDADESWFVDITDSVDKASILKTACEGQSPSRTFVRKHQQFLNSPGSPLSYRLNPEIVASLAEGVTLSDLVEGAWGLFTAADERFTRLWWEVDPSKLGTKWLPYAKGGTPQAFFAEPLLVVRWDADGSEILSRRGDRGQVLARAPNKESYGNRGLTYSSISSAGFRVRPLNEGVIFSIKGPALFPRQSEEHWFSLLELLNTGQASYLLSTLSSNRSAELNYAMRISIPQNWEKHFSGEVADKLFLLQRWFATGRETSRFFLGYPLTRDENSQTGHILASELLEKLNQAGDNAFASFRLSNEDVERFRPSRQHLSAPTTPDEHSILSYVVGVAFGRWQNAAISAGELAKQLPGAFSPIPSIPIAASNARLRTADSPKALVDDPGHALDIVELIASYGKKLDASCVLFENRDVLRALLRNDFWEAHISEYSAGARKAPIYWQFSIPSKKYSVWLYIDAFSPDALYHLHNELVGPKLTLEEQRLADMRREHESPVGRVSRKDLSAQEDFVDELRLFLAEIKRLAPLWRPDLDDGVLINFALSWRLVPQHASWQKELIEVWDELVAGKHDWAHLAIHLWPERVVPKCITDRSLAIAHGLEEVFWQKDRNEKWQPRPTPTRPVDELVRERTSPAVKAALKALMESADTAAPARRRARNGRRAPA